MEMNFWILKIIKITVIKKNSNIEINNQDDENIIQKKNSKMSKSVNILNLNDNSNYNDNLDDESKN